MDQSYLLLPRIGQGGKRLRPIADLFWRKVDKSGDCWLWTGSQCARGYGHMAVTLSEGRRFLPSHRLAYILCHGTIPDGLWVLHNCPNGDNPRCCNPAHLYLGTPRDNTQDAIRKGRWCRGAASPNAKLRPAQVIEIRRRHAEEGCSMPALAAQYGVSDSLIFAIVHRQSWKHI